MKNVEEKSEIVNIRKENDNKVVVETRSGTNTLKSTIYIFPQDIFISGTKKTITDKK